MRMCINPPGESNGRYTTAFMSGPAAVGFSFGFIDHGPYIWPPLPKPRVSYRSPWEGFTLAMYEFESIDAYGFAFPRIQERGYDMPAKDIWRPPSRGWPALARTE